MEGEKRDADTAELKSEYRGCKTNETNQWREMEVGEYCALERE